MVESQGLNTVKSVIFIGHLGLFTVVFAVAALSVLIITAHGLELVLEKETTSTFSFSYGLSSSAFVMESYLEPCTYQ